MRNRWEAGAEKNLDEPVTITERQFQSLRRGARAGRLAVLLALVAMGAALLALVVGPEALAGVDGVQSAREKLLSAIGKPPPMEVLRAEAMTTDSLWLPDTSQNADSPRGLDSVRAASPAPRSGDSERSTP